VIFGTRMIGIEVAELLCAAGVWTYGIATAPRRLTPFARVEGALEDLSLEHVDWAIAVLPLTPATRGHFTRESSKGSVALISSTSAAGRWWKSALSLEPSRMAT
jgi:phosphoglycerate dehydrogenase-like enzyme